MGNRDNRKVFRIKLEEPLKVVMGSIGADIKYDLLTNDISPNGFFLDFESPGRFPFNPSSIMEVWLTLASDNEIFFNGKMARVVYPNPEDSSKPGRPGIAIRIVQIEPEEEKKLLDFIEEKAESQEGKSLEEPDVAV